MIALLDNGQDLDECEHELGTSVGQLLTPLTRYTLRKPDGLWAVDNGAYTAFDSGAFWGLLAREQHHAKNCLFVAVPDVVESARRTLEVFQHMKHDLKGWKLAFVCQDGQENLTIPWADCSSVFIGGSTDWKCSPHAAHIIKAAKILRRWVHVGRVNHALRWKHFEQLGVDSVDGSGIARYSHMRRAINGRNDQSDWIDNSVPF